jgi:Putative adhesin
MVRVSAVLFCIAAAVPAHAQSREARPPQTDQTIQVSRGMRLAVDNMAGDVVVHVWDKDALRVQARHPARTRINIRNRDNVVSLSANESSGPSGAIDYDITAPAWLPLTIDGQFNDVTVEGVQGDVAVETVRGDIVLKGTSGAVEASTIEGEIVVDGARGKISLSSVNEGIKVSGTSGELSAETTNGSITLTRMTASSIEAATVNGDISYEGTLVDKGGYNLQTHNGDILVTVPEGSNATFSVRTYNGEFATSLPLKGPDRSEVKPGKRAIYTLGTGSADVELESFGGAIQLRRTGAPRTSRD